MSKKQAQERIEKLRHEIERHRYLYHVKDTQEISDEALDSLKRELVALETEHPDLVTPDSPTQRVGGKPLPEFQQVRHNTRMLSLNDVFNLEEIAQWVERNKKIVDEPYEFFTELKIDGVALALIYQNGTLVQAATRGDGFVGEDVTQNAKTIDAIPLTLREPVKGRMEVRGEVYIDKKDFEMMNTERKNNGEKPFANPRNIAAGSMRQLDPRITQRRKLKFFAWEITEGIARDTRMQEYETLQRLGFPVPPSAQVCNTLQEVRQIIEQEEQNRESYPFQVDGLVIKINAIKTANRLGIVGKSPRASVAYKFAAQEATTVVEDIVVQVGRTGVLTPVAHLSPVQVAGSVVSRATLHNAQEVHRKDVRVGDTVIIRKAGDIIPEVVEVIPRLRPDGTKEFEMPRRCPMCDSELRKEEEGVIVRCTNKRCFSQQKEQILHAVGRSGFDIAGIGEKIVEQLLQEGLIEDVPDLWELKVGDLLPLERFAEKSAKNLIQELQQKKTYPLGRFLIALGIPNVGTVTAHDIARRFGSVENVMHATKDQLVELDGIGDKVADGIVSYLRDNHTKHIVQRYKDIGMEITRETTRGALHDKTFVFTGSMENMTRNEAKQIVQEQGGRVAASVSNTVDYVVVGEDAGSKEKKAREMGIPMLTPHEFRELISATARQ